ncbi:hypothetical protein V2G26_009674 [Clonostachys chloroleuca]|uniref:GAT domain-containing protein n=1 Tax=Clonostachys chloroleuca TaxID=1926264 RepID=A0AA35LYU3_9HYPO|nr:unnamed protein product [Clonostachys chloroleuca]
MKSMKKSLSMGKMLGSIRRKTSGLQHGEANNGATSATAPVPQPTQGTTPEETARNNVEAFCEAGGNVKGDEILFLPLIVEAAESSPSAAAECARVIRKFLGKDYITRPSWQYNALMILRILCDNPGPSFTRSFDQDFVDTVRKLLGSGKDNKVQRMLMEILDDFEFTRMDDGNLVLLIEMWKKEKAAAYTRFGAPRRQEHRRSHQASANFHSQNYFARSHSNKRLPDPVELASRLEEARTSAKLLEQVVMNTPPAEMLQNELIREFADRCQSASRSIQGYMTAENPTPDNETMESLIDTNEQLQTALNQHRRAVLNARKQLGLNERTPDEFPPLQGQRNGQDRVLQWTQSQADILAAGAHVPVTTEEQQPVNNGKGKETQPYGLGGDRDRAQEDPFADPKGEEEDGRGLQYPEEPFHPGFRASTGAGAAPAAGISPVAGASLPPSATVHKSSLDNSNALLKPQPRDDKDSESDIYDAGPRTKEPEQQPVYKY